MWPYILATTEPPHVLAAWIQDVAEYCRRRFAAESCTIRETFVESLREYGAYLPLKSRPTWLRYHEKMQPGDHLVVPDLSHIYTAPKTTARMVSGLRERGVTVHLVKAASQFVESGTPRGDAFFDALEVLGDVTFTEKQRQLSKYTLIRKRHDIAFYTKENESGELVFDPEVRLLMKQIVRWRNEGMGRRAIGRKLKPLGLSLTDDQVALYDHVERAIQSIRHGPPRSLPPQNELVRIGRELYNQRKKPSEPR